MSRHSAPFAPDGAEPIDETFLGRLLSTALSAGGDYADLFFEYRASGTLSWDEGILENATRGVTMGLGVRVLKGDGTGFAYTEQLTEDAMLAAAKTAAQIASGGNGAELEALAKKHLPNRYPYEHLTLDVEGATKREILRRADVAARNYDSRIQRVKCSLVENVREVLVATSDGALAHDRQPILRFNVMAIAEDGDKRQSGRGGGGGRVGLDYFLTKGNKPEDHGREAARIAIDMLHAQEAPAGEMTVVLAPGDSGILLHEAVGHGLEADFNRKKTSNYTDQVGNVVASELVSVVDDPSYPNARGSINVDDEGNVAEPVTLIENGVLRGYMQDRQSAKYFDTKSGNGRRETFRHVPMPRMTNTIMTAGPHTPEEIIASVKKGVFAKRFSGGSVNISNGDFVFSLTESYLIEDGKITAPLKGVNLIGNGPDVLRKVDMLGTDVELSDGIWTCGKDGQSVPVGVGCPTTRIASITVGGTQVGS
ncbi:MAG: metallopeptidase TldD-related protein [Deltaproteobacteria bacterium]|jgi:TldD protein